MTRAAAVTLVGQADLFASRGELAIDTSFNRAIRTALGATSWVELVPGWLSRSADLFNQLVRDAPWQQHRRYVFGHWFDEPRLTDRFC
jgi:hypothetical protein